MCIRDRPTIEDIKEEIKLAKIIIDTVKGEMLSGIVRIVFRSIIT